MVNILIVSPKGDLRINKAAIFTAEGLAKALRKAKPPVVIGTWLVDDGAVELTLWGWREAYAATVKSATFVFPAPHKKLTLYGDAVITAVRDGKAVDMTEDMWIAACAEIEEMEDDAPVAAGGAGAAAAATPAEEGGDADSDADEEDDFDDDDIDGDMDEGGDAAEEAGDDEEDAEVEDGEEDGEEDAEEDDMEDGEDDCYDSDDGGGGGKRRAPRRRAMAAPEFRRMEMGLRARIKMPAPAGKRAPKWQTAPELEPE